MNNDRIDFEVYAQQLQDVKKRLDVKEIDEIPLNVRPKMLDFDFDKDSYIVVSYSRKDFEKVYLLLAHLHDEGYRFWYDNGMKGTEKWLKEYREKFENPNCLGTITFFSDNYISDSTKEELGIIYENHAYKKKNDMISLVALGEMDANRMLKAAISNDRVSIENAATVKPVLEEIIEEERQKTIHRFMGDSDIPDLIEKIGKDFNIQNAKETKKSDLRIRNNIVEGIGICEDTNIVIPEGVKKIGDNAFKGLSWIESVSIPNSVTEIGDSAFEDCLKLTSISIPDGVESIGDFAFKHTGLNVVNIGNGLEAIGYGAFADCFFLQPFDIPKTVSEIGNDIFVRHADAVPTDIGDIIGDWDENHVAASKGMRIKDGVLQNVGICEDKNIIIPSGVTKIADHAFATPNEIESIVLPDGVTNIGKNAFIGCSSLKSITIPNSVEHIGEEAFCGCRSLKSITIPNRLRHIGKKVFSGCRNLSSITIPYGIMDIGEEAFSRCDSLTSITIPYVVNRIGKNAFKGCSSLTSINTQTYSLKYIDEGAFRGCSSLSSIIMPYGVTQIGMIAFVGCKNLVSISIPNSVEAIYGGAFWGCRNLKSIAFDGTKEQWSAIKKNEKWDYDTSNYIIHCTDGDIKKSDQIEQDKNLISRRIALLKTLVTNEPELFVLFSKLEDFNIINRPISIALIQRVMSCSWPHAARLYDTMDKKGFLSLDEQNPQKKVINVTKAEVNLLRHGCL